MSLSNPSCNTTAGVPRGPFPPSSANYTQPPHCVFPSYSNTTSILRSCLNSTTTNTTSPSFYVFADEDHPGCEYVYVNVTKSGSESGSASGGDLLQCWVRENRGVPAGCYGSGGSLGGGGGGSGENGVLPGSAGERVVVGGVWGVIVWMATVVMVAGFSVCL